MNSTPSTQLRNAGRSLSAGANVAIIAAGVSTMAITRHPEPVKTSDAPAVGLGTNGRALDAVLVADHALRLLMVKALCSDVALGDEITALLMAASSATSAGIPGNCSPAEAHATLDRARQTIQQLTALEDGIGCIACNGFMIDYTDHELICDTCGTTAPRRGSHGGHN